MSMVFCSNYVRARGVFLYHRCMDKLFLSRMNSWQGIVRKEQETIFETSIGSLYYFKVLLKIRFWHVPVLSNDS
jgi:hypothetical protein